MAKYNKTHYVLDTNVLIHDPSCLFSFDKDSIVVIPYTVLQELDNLKKEPNERGANARKASKLINNIQIDEIKNKIKSNIHVQNRSTSSNAVSYKDGDDSILFEINNNIKLMSNDVRLITKDVIMQVKARTVCGIVVEDYHKVVEGIDSEEELYKGFYDLELTEADYKGFVLGSVKSLLLSKDYPKLPENCYLFIYGPDREETEVIARYSKGYLTKVRNNISAGGIKPKNDGQLMAFDALMNDKIPMVSLVGKAGTGKTLIAAAVGVYKALSNSKRYERVIITRPNVPMSKDMDIGLLPGDANAKMDPWLQPIYDNMKLLQDSKVDEVKTKEILETAPLCYIRGRSLNNAFIIIDETQNLSPDQVKTIISRVGKNSKIVLTGDIEQIDKHTLNKYTNGLTHVTRHFKGQELYAHVELTKTERSKLAELAADLL